MIAVRKAENGAQRESKQKGVKNMKFKKSILNAILLCLFSITLSLNSFANILSPAMSVISESFSIKLSGLAGEKICFSESLLTGALGSKIITKIKLLSLPDDKFGKLELDGNELEAGIEIHSSELSELVFIPSTKESACDSFDIEVCSFGQEYRIECTLVMLDNLNFGPRCNNTALNFSTYSGIPVYGKLEGYDPENDDIVFEITTYPRKGIARMNNKNKGTFVYSPDIDAQGSDKFEYKIIDSCGAESETITVSINLNELSGKPYSDMTGSEYEYYATFLSEKRIFKGISIGEECFFQPNERLSYDEFRSMVNAAIKCESSILNEQYKADEETFALDGFFAAFEPSSEITFSQAAAMLDELCNYDLFSFEACADLNDYSLPVALFLSNTEIELPQDKKECDPVTRAQASEMIVKALFD